MAGWLLEEAWKQGPRLKDRELLALLAYADFADEAGMAWPSVDTVAARVRVSVSTARRLIRSLERLGCIERATRGVGGRGRSTLYRVLPAKTRSTISDRVSGDTRDGKPGQHTDRVSSVEKSGTVRKKHGQTGTKTRSSRVTDKQGRTKDSPLPPERAAVESRPRAAGRSGFGEPDLAALQGARKFTGAEPLASIIGRVLP